MYPIVYKSLRTASLILLLFFISGCGAPPATASAPTCPPMANLHIATISGGGDASSVEVPAGTYAYQDPYSSTNKISWCDAEADSQLGIQPYPLSTLPSPPPYNSVLTAHDIKPDNITFPVAANRPTLTFELKPGTYSQNPENCGKSTSCYAFYRYSYSEGSWKYAGYAGAVQTGGIWFAQGSVNHFSIYALVELPPPQTLPGGQELTLQVASEFLEDEMGSMSVAFRVINDSSGQLSSDVPEYILQFFSVDLAGIDGTPPDDCLKMGSYPEEFSCLFRVGAQVILQLGLAQDPNLQILIYPDGAYQVRFYSNPVLAH